MPARRSLALQYRLETSTVIYVISVLINLSTYQCQLANKVSLPRYNSPHWFQIKLSQISRYVLAKQPSILISKVIFFHKKSSILSIALNIAKPSVFKDLLWRKRYIWMFSSVCHWHLKLDRVQTEFWNNQSLRKIFTSMFWSI